MSLLTPRIRPNSKLTKNRQKKNESFKPQLTSLIDVMTILLIYLLKSFSAEGEIVTVSKDLMFPESSAQKKPELTVVLTVNNQYILAEGQKVVSVDMVSASDDLVIKKLNEWLENRRQMTQNNDQYTDHKK